MENLDAFANDEQLLDLAMWVLVRDPDNEIAGNIVICYCYNQLLQQGVEEFDEKVIEKMYGDLFVQYTKDLMVKEGMGEVSFDEDGPHYTFTPEGEACLFKIVQSKYRG